MIKAANLVQRKSCRKRGEIGKIPLQVNTLRSQKNPSPQSFWVEQRASYQIILPKYLDKLIRK